MLAYAGVCWRMLAYAGVCWRMLAYAGVCWRMLLHADISKGGYRLVLIIAAYADVC
jgi:hypothetical protein